MVISLVLGSHHWLIIKWFLPCSTSEHCNHMDRIVLCGRRDEDPGHLFKSSHCFFPKLRWSFVYLAWIQICIFVAMLKFTSVWHRATLYVWSYVQVWVLYHMDLRCILVAMLVYSFHGSALYCSTTMSLVTCVYESTYLCTTDAYLTTCSDWANIFTS